jgi:hypothetical protein
MTAKAILLPNAATQNRSPDSRLATGVVTLSGSSRSELRQVTFESHERRPLTVQRDGLQLPYSEIITSVLWHVLWGGIVLYNPAGFCVVMAVLFPELNRHNFAFPTQEVSTAHKQCLTMWHAATKVRSIVLFPITANVLEFCVLLIQFSFVRSRFSFNNTSRSKTLVIMNVHCMSFPVRLIYSLNQRLIQPHWASCDNSHTVRSIIAARLSSVVISRWP